MTVLDAHIHMPVPARVELGPLLGLTPPSMAPKSSACPPPKPCCAPRGEGLEEGLAWLIDTVREQRSGGPRPPPPPPANPPDKPPEEALLEKWLQVGRGLMIQKMRPPACGPACWCALLLRQHGRVLIGWW
jgi:hypothetical protein